MAIARLQTGASRGAAQCLSQIELWLDRERDHLASWVPVTLGIGIAAWFILQGHIAWIAVMVGGAALALIGFVIGRKWRIGGVFVVAGIGVALGCAMMWWRAERVAAPTIERPMVVQFEATVTHVELQGAKAQSRLLLVPDKGAALPPLIRVTVKDEDGVAGLAAGDRIALRARLVPPPEAAIPGGYDFARTAWFLRLGATGSAMGKVVRLTTAPPDPLALRARLSAHVRGKIDGSAGGIASAFASGDRGGIAPEDEDAMRASGLTHLLSISGLHITAVVAAMLFVTLRLLALSPALALRLPLPLVAAGMGALAGIGYTLLTGAEVPTIRSCVAALLVLGGLALGREALTLRLVATGAIIVLLVWPEALIGPSFQLSFAAITVIVALHESPIVKRWTMRRDEVFGARMLRAAFSLILTGLAVEVALAPIALFHFHKSGIYGALANVIAIPLTTFVTMPLEALALLFDAVGAGAPFWWLTGLSLDFLLWLARKTAAVPGAVAVLPEIPVGAFGLIIIGGLWLLLWKTRARLLGLLPILLGALWSFLLPAPDLLITGDGKHLAVRGTDGGFVLLRPRAGDYIRDVLAERAGTLDPLADIDAAKGAQCGRDLCVMTITRGGKAWRIAATRSDYLLPWLPFIATCQSVDIIVSSRRLPHKCKARWITADRTLLESSGGLAITLGTRWTKPRIATVFESHDDHPWRRAPIIEARRPQHERRQ